LALAAVACAGCAGEARPGFNDEEWALVESLTGAEPPAPCPPELTPSASDPECERLAELGRHLFFDTRLSGPIEVGDDGANGGLGAAGEVGRVACASCHTPPWFVDHRSRPNATSLGTGWVTRNAPTVVNAAYYEDLTWIGKWPDLSRLVEGPMENEAFMAGDRLWLARLMFADYRGEYEALFGPLDRRLQSNDIYDGTYDELAADSTLRQHVDGVLLDAGHAIAAYERRLVSIDAPFDRWVRDPDAPMSEAAIRGLELFIGDAACIECHSGPMLADDNFYNTGVAQVGLHVPAVDEGRGELAEYRDQIGRFRTPSLRNVAETAPYMHTGSEPTLEDVVWFYHQGGDASGFSGEKEIFMVPLDLSEAEMADLVAFMLALTGDLVEERWRDNPFEYLDAGEMIR
jgi:cytochrome c peroxidase